MAKRSWGLPYMGSKNTIVKHVVEALPKGERLVDLCPQVVDIIKGYSDYVYRDGDVVYCDPPYKGTGGYGIEFNVDAFWEWVRTRNYPVYVSEYQAPEDFVSIWAKEKRSLFNDIGLTAPRTEHLFLHKRFADGTP